MANERCCVECGRPFRWEGPGVTGRIQGWYRHSEPGPHGERCFYREACAAAAAAARLTLFEP